MPFGAEEMKSNSDDDEDLVIPFRSLIVCLDLRNGTVIINAFCWLWINVFDCEMLASARTICGGLFFAALMD